MPSLAMELSRWTEVLEPLSEEIPSSLSAEDRDTRLTKTEQNRELPVTWELSLHSGHSTPSNRVKSWV